MRWWLGLAMACQGVPEGEGPDAGQSGQLETSDTPDPAAEEKPTATGCAAVGVVCTALGLPGLSLNNGPEGEASTFGLHLPTGVAVGNGGAVFVADESNHRIVELRPDSSVLTVAGTGYVGDTVEGPIGGSPLHGPSAVFFEGGGTRGTLLVTTRGTARAVRIDLDAGTVAHVAGAGVRGYNGEIDADSARLSQPRGVTGGPNGAVYIADTGNHLIRTVGADGRLVNLAGRAGEGRHSGDGGLAREATVHSPVGIAVDGNILYFADSGSHTLRAIDLAAGTIDTVAGIPNTSGNADGPGASATFHFPSGLALDTNGGLFVAEEYNHCIRRVDRATRTVTRYAGTCGQSGFGGDGGPRLAALVASPMGLAWGPDGVVWLADTGNQVIRSIHP